MKKLTPQKFIEKAKEVHGDTYDYEKCAYSKMRKKIIISCKRHGDFEMLPSSHINQKQGCKECKRFSRLNNRRLTTEQFIEKAKQIHGDTYDYSLVEYKNNKTKVKIICSIHGVFEQEANSHLQGFNCLKCGVVSREKKMKNRPRGWSYKKWEKSGLKSKNFDSFKVYIIKCWNENEEFYKIGKTFRNLKNRFYTKTLLPYNYSVVKIFEGGAEEMSKLEKELSKENKEYSYLPQIKFHGMKECFKKIN